MNIKDNIFIVFTIILVISNIIFVSSQSNVNMQDRMYYSLIGYPCTRIMTIDGQFGCSSSHGGDSGILYLIDDDDSYNGYFKYNQQSDVIVVLDSNYFNKTLVMDMYSRKKMKGVIVLRDNPKTYGYSPELSYPLKQYGLYPNSNINWNPNADGFTYEEFPFPMFAVDNDDFINIRQVASENRGGKYPAYGAELDSFMQGAINAETCLRRGFCEPVGGQSIWTSLSKTIDTSKNIILLMLPFDTTAFFRDIATGTDQSAYALIALISVLKNLSVVNKNAAKNGEVDTWNQEIVFAFWNAERWGYIGSTNFVNDLLHFKCTTVSSDNPNVCSNPPTMDLAFASQIDFTKISAIIELNQLGNPVDSGKVNGLGDPIYNLVYHVGGTGDTTKITNIIDSVATSFNSTIEFISTTSTEIPPCSSMSFLKVNSSIPTLIITDHDQQYRNNYFGDAQDNFANVIQNKTQLYDIITILTKSIDLLAGGPGNVAIDKSFTDSVYSCFVNSMGCPLLIKLFATYPLNPIPNFYSSVYGVSPSNQIMPIETRFLYKLITHVTQFNSTHTNCTRDSQCDNVCMEGSCVESNTHYHNALSLAFSYDNSKNSWIISNSSYPVFVESNWDYTTVRLFVLGSYSNEIWFLVSGLVELLVSVGVIYYIKNYLSKRYKLL